MAKVKHIQIDDMPDLANLLPGAIYFVRNENIIIQTNANGEPSIFYGKKCIDCGDISLEVSKSKKILQNDFTRYLKKGTNNMYLDDISARRFIVSLLRQYKSITIKVSGYVKIADTSIQGGRGYLKATCHPQNSYTSVMGFSDLDKVYFETSIRLQDFMINDTVDELPIVLEPSDYTGSLEPNVEFLDTGSVKVDAIYIHTDTDFVTDVSLKCTSNNDEHPYYVGGGYIGTL